MGEASAGAGNESQNEAAQDIEAVLMAFWRRVTEEGCGPELSIAEAAAVLGTSVQSVRHRVATGLIPAYRDAHGRIRIVPRVPIPSPQAEESSSIGRLKEDLKATRELLNQAVRELAGLLEEKADVERALELTKEELSAMWRLLSAGRVSRNHRFERDEPVKREEREAPARLNVNKVQAQVLAARKLARRRRWPWALVSCQTALSFRRWLEARS